MSAIKRRPDLEDDQKFALMKFRRSVEDVLGPNDDDFYLVRWLRARKWNAEAAEKMLRNAHRNKQMWNVDQLENWERPPVLIDYVPQGLSGFDREGSPIIVVPFAGMDMYGILHCVTQSDFMRSTVLLLERYSKLGFENSKTQGINARQFVVFFDMENFNLKQYAWRPAAELVISLVKNYELHYPEILKICYIVNAPKIFSVAFNFVKKFMDEYTTSKIMIFKQGSTKWQSKLFEHVDPAQFPKFYGGTLTDEDGDPKCKSKICWGGKIPIAMYTKRNEDNNNADYTETVVNMGTKLKLEFDCVVEGSMLRWDFRTYGHDIRFGIKSIDNKTGEHRSEIPLARVCSNEMDEVGFITCQENCKYLFVFDNTYSYLRSKKVRYSIGMSPPIAELEEAADQIVEQI